MEEGRRHHLLKTSPQGSRPSRALRREQIRNGPTNARYEEQTVTRLDSQPNPNRYRVGRSYGKTDYSFTAQTAKLPALCPPLPWNQKRPVSLKPQRAQDSSLQTDTDRSHVQPWLTVAKPPRFRPSCSAYAEVGGSIPFQKTTCRPPLCEGDAEQAARSSLYGQLPGGMAGSGQPPGSLAGGQSQQAGKTSAYLDRNQAATFPSSSVMSQLNKAPPSSKVSDICQILDKSQGAVISSPAHASLKPLSVQEGQVLSHPGFQTAFQKQSHSKSSKNHLQPILPRASSKKMAPARSKRDQKLIQCDVFSEMVTTKRLYSEGTKDRHSHFLSDSTVENHLLPIADTRLGTQLPMIKASNATLQTTLGQTPLPQRCTVAEASPHVGSGNLYAEKPFRPLHPDTFPNRYWTMHSHNVTTKNKNMNSKHVTTESPFKYERSKKSKTTRKASFVKTLSKINNNLSVIHGHMARNIKKYIPFKKGITQEHGDRANINNHAVEDDNPVENQLPNISGRPSISEGVSRGSSDKMNTYSSGSRSTRGSIHTQDSQAQDQKMEASSANSVQSSATVPGEGSKSIDSSLPESCLINISKEQAEESEQRTSGLESKDQDNADMNEDDSDLKQTDPEMITRASKKNKGNKKVKADNKRNISSKKPTRSKTSKTQIQHKAIPASGASQEKDTVSATEEMDQDLETSQAASLDTCTAELQPPDLMPQQSENPLPETSASLLSEGTASLMLDMGLSTGHLLESSSVVLPGRSAGHQLSESHSPLPATCDADHQSSTSHSLPPNRSGIRIQVSRTHTTGSSTLSSTMEETEEDDEKHDDDDDEDDEDDFDDEEDSGERKSDMEKLHPHSQVIDSKKMLKPIPSSDKHARGVSFEDPSAVSSRFSASASASRDRSGKISGWRTLRAGLLMGLKLKKKPQSHGQHHHLFPQAPSRSVSGHGNKDTDSLASLQDTSSGSQSFFLSQSTSTADTGHALASHRLGIAHVSARSKELVQKVRAWKKTMTYVVKTLGTDRLAREGKQKQQRRDSLEEKDIRSYHIYALAQQVIRKQTHNLSLRRWFKATRTVIYTSYFAKAMAQRSIDIFMKLPTFMDIGDYYRKQGQANTTHFIDATSFQLKGFKGDGFCMNPEVVNILCEDPQGRTEAQINLVLHKLQQIDSFCDFPLHAQRAMARLGFYCCLRDKRVIISEGQVPHNFYFILSGQAVASTIEARDGRVFRQTLRILSKGQMFGEVAIINNTSRGMTVRARTNMQLLYIDRNDYVDIFMPERKQDGVPDYVKFLSTQSWMKDWPVHLLMDNTKMCYPRYFRQQQVIVANSMSSENLYVIRSGECQVVNMLDTMTTTWRDVNRLLSEHFLIKDTHLVMGLYREEQMKKLQSRKLGPKVRPLSASDIRDASSGVQFLPDHIQHLSTLLPLAVCQVQNLYHQRCINIMTSTNTMGLLMELSGHDHRMEKFHPDSYLQQNSSAVTDVSSAQEDGTVSGSGRPSSVDMLGPGSASKKPAPSSKARHCKSANAQKKRFKRQASLTANTESISQGSLSSSKHLVQSSELIDVVPNDEQTPKIKGRGRGVVKRAAKKSLRKCVSPTSTEARASIASYSSRPSTWKSVPQSSWAKRQQYQVPKQCRPHVSQEANGQARSRKGPFACVQVLKLGEGDVFGFDQLDMQVCAQSKSYPAALVSCGAEVIVLKKRFFLQHASFSVQQAVHLATISIPSPEEVKYLWRIEQARELYQRSLREQLTRQHNRC